MEALNVAYVETQDRGAINIDGDWIDFVGLKWFCMA